MRKELKMLEFIEFVKACGTVLLPLAAIILSIAAICVSLFKKV